jgi:hypothetical protein
VSPLTPWVQSGLVHRWVRRRDCGDWGREHVKGLTTSGLARSLAPFGPAVLYYKVLWSDEFVSISSFGPDVRVTREPSPPAVIERFVEPYYLGPALLRRSSRGEGG